MINLKEFEIMEAKEIFRKWKRAIMKVGSGSHNPMWKASKYKQKWSEVGKQARLLNSRSSNLYSKEIPYWILIRDRSSGDKEQKIVSGIKFGRDASLSSISSLELGFWEVGSDGLLEPVDQETSKDILDLTKPRKSPKIEPKIIDRLNEQEENYRSISKKILMLEIKKMNKEV